jgi:hypothetical protein
LKLSAFLTHTAQKALVADRYRANCRTRLDLDLNRMASCEVIIPLSVMQERPVATNGSFAATSGHSQEVHFLPILLQKAFGMPNENSWRALTRSAHGACTLNARNPPGKTAISVIFNERCDMIAATGVLGHDRPATTEPSVIEFLNSNTVMRWAEITLGL